MRMRKCPRCGKYTLKQLCVNCNVATITPAPPKFSPTDRFGEWRRRLIKERG